jgi:hypothetical protein
VQNGTATGVEIADGTVITADKFIVSSLDPEQTFMKLIGKENMDLT